MKTRFFLSLLVLFVVTLISIPSHADDAKDKAEIIKLGRSLDAGMIKKDYAPLAKILSDDFVGIWADGNTSTKSEILEALKNGQYKLHSVDYKEENVRIYGSTAVSTVLASADEETDGKREQTLGWNTSVWVKKSDQWKIVSVHSSYKEKKTSQ